MQAASSAEILDSMQFSGVPGRRRGAPGSSRDQRLTELRGDEVGSRNECGTKAADECHQSPSLGVDLLMKILAGGDGSQARLDPCKPITRFKISRFKGNDSGIHSAIIATAAGVVNR